MKPSGNTPAPAAPEPKIKGGNLDIKALMPKLKKLWQKFAVHVPFAIIVVVLFVYLFVVWQIKNFAAVEPSPDAESQAAASAKISRIDKNAIAQIQDLEENSPQIKALFDKARKSPFNE
jgi:hypothetical protein